MNAPIRKAFDCSSRKPMRKHFVSGFPRALLSLSQEKSSGVEIETRVSRDAQNVWAVTIVGTVLNQRTEVWLFFHCFQVREEYLRLIRCQSRSDAYAVARPWWSKSDSISRSRASEKIRRSTLQSNLETPKVLTASLKYCSVAYS